MMQASQIALSGMNVAMSQMAVASHNLANQQTDEFHQQRVELATSSPFLVNQGAGPDKRSGGTNPRQAGTGVVVQQVTEDTTAGSQVVTSSGVRELSNTDIGSNLIDMVLAESQFRTSLQVIRTETSLLDELMSLIDVRRS